MIVQELGGSSRVRVYLIQKATPIILIKDTRKAPGLLLKRLHILDLHDQNVARLSSLDLERPSQVVDLGQIDILHVVRAIVISNLPARPVHAFNLDDLAVLDRSVEGDWDSG